MNITHGLKKFALTASIALLVAPAFAQTTATTDPVGYISLEITPSATAGVAKYSYKGLGLTRTVAYQGSAETSTGGTTTIVDNEATWTDNQFNGASAAITHFVEITSGAAAGTTYDIVATVASTKTLTLAQSLAASVTAGSTFKIRQHWTIGSVFGAANEGGLQGGTSTSADQVLSWNGSGFDTYYYQTSGFGGIGWRKSGAPTVPKDGALIYPEDGLVVKRNQTTPLSIVLMGSVKLGQTSIPVVSGYNYTSNVNAAPMTLASSGLYTGVTSTGLAGGTSTGADQVLVWNGTGYDTYYYQTSGFGGIGWRRSGAPTVDASTTSIGVGVSVVLNRKNAAAFNWVVPQHPASI